MKKETRKQRGVVTHGNPSDRGQHIALLMRKRKEKVGINYIKPPKNIFIPNQMKILMKGRNVGFSHSAVTEHITANGQDQFYSP